MDELVICYYGPIAHPVMSTQQHIYSGRANIFLAAVPFGLMTRAQTHLPRLDIIRFIRVLPSDSV